MFLSLFSNKVFIKNETLAQVLSCEFCKISKNNVFPEPLGDCFWIKFITDVLELSI